MLASVVIPSYNRPSLVLRTVRSVVIQNVSAGDFEVIVVDDHSDPPVTEAFRGWRLPDRVRVIRCEQNMGRAGARNVGIQAARGDILVMLDDDIEVVPSFLEAHLTVHGAHERAVVLGKVLAAPELGRSAFFRYLDSRGPEKIRRGRPVPSKYFVTGNSSVQRSVFDEMGSFDEAFNVYGGEDTELGIRLGKAGFEFRYAPEALGYHLEIVDIDRLCERLVAYGREALPRMVVQHPELKSLLSLDVLDPPDWGSEPVGRSLKRLLFQAMLKPGTFRFARRLADANMPGRVLYPVFDYLRAYSYMTGYLEGLERGEG